MQKEEIPAKLQHAFLMPESIGEQNTFYRQIQGGRTAARQGRKGPSREAAQCSLLVRSFFGLLMLQFPILISACKTSCVGGPSLFSPPFFWWKISAQQTFQPLHVCYWPPIVTPFNTTSFGLSWSFSYYVPSGACILAPSLGLTSDSAVGFAAVAPDIISAEHSRPECACEDTPSEALKALLMRVSTNLQVQLLIELATSWIAWVAYFA